MSKFDGIGQHLYMARLHDMVYKIPNKQHVPHQILRPDAPDPYKSEYAGYASYLLEVKYAVEIAVDLF